MTSFYSKYLQDCCRLIWLKTLKAHVYKLREIERRLCWPKKPKKLTNRWQFTYATPLTLNRVINLENSFQDIHFFFFFIHEKVATQWVGGYQFTYRFLCVRKILVLLQHACTQNRWQIIIWTMYTLLRLQEILDSQPHKFFPYESQIFKPPMHEDLII